MAVLITSAFQSFLVLQLAIARMRQLGDSPRPIYQAIAQYGESSTRIRFQRGVAPSGERWKPSARVLASGGQTLVNKGAHGGLLGSITSRSDNASAEWGTNKVYAGIHQFGGTIVPRVARNLRFAVPGGFVATKRVQMPERQFLGVNDEDGQEIQQVILDVVQDAEHARMGRGF